MKLPQYFKVYNQHKSKEYFLSGLLFLCALILGKILIDQVTKGIHWKELLFVEGLVVVFLLTALFLFSRAQSAAFVLLSKSGVQYKSGNIAYSQFSHIKAAFLYQQVTLIRKERPDLNVILQFPAGHEGRTQLYALSAKTKIPVQEDYFSSDLRQPNGRITSDPHSDLEKELLRKDDSSPAYTPLVVSREEESVTIATPIFPKEKIVPTFLSMTMLGVGAWFVYIFLQEIKVVDIWMYNLGIAIPGSIVLVLLCVLVFGYSIVETITERITIGVDSQQLTVSTRKGFSKEIQQFRLSSVIGVVIQPVGWVDGYGWGNVAVIYDCILLTERETIPLGIASQHCHQLQGLLATALDELSRGY